MASSIPCGLLKATLEFAILFRLRATTLQFGSARILRSHSSGLHDGDKK
jgi:hypothetical protein